MINWFPHLINLTEITTAQTTARFMWWVMLTKQLAGPYVSLVGTAMTYFLCRSRHDFTHSNCKPVHSNSVKLRRSLQSLVHSISASLLKTATQYTGKQIFKLGMLRHHYFDHTWLRCACAGEADDVRWLASVDVTAAVEVAGTGARRSVNGVATGTVWAAIVGRQAFRWQRQTSQSV